MKRLPVLLASAAAVALSGCAHPENYRWRQTSSPSFDSTLRDPGNSRFLGWAEPGVSVYSVAAPAPAASELSLRDLSAEGQAAFIQAMTAPGADPDRIRDLLARPLRARADAGEGASTTEGTYKRTLVTNVTRGWNSRPGERLVWTWVDIRPLNFLFDGYTVAATEHRTINLQTIQNATAASIGASLGQTSSDTSSTTTANPPVTSVLGRAAGATAGLTGSMSNTNTTSATINQQYVGLGIDIQPRELRILRESERNLDASGNTQLALSLRTTPGGWRDVRQVETLRVTRLDLVDEVKDGPPVPRTNANIILEVAVNQAPPRCDLVADVTLYYQMRKVEDGRSHIEGDHDPRYVQDDVEVQEVVIVPAGEVRKPAWRIYPPDRSQALQVTDTFNNHLPLDFTSYDQARNFAEWINRNIEQFAGEESPQIGMNGLKLSSGATGEPIFPGPYSAAMPRDPDNLSALCRGTWHGDARPPAAAAGSTGRPPGGPLESPPPARSP